MLVLTAAFSSFPRCSSCWCTVAVHGLANRRRFNRTRAATTGRLIQELNKNKNRQTKNMCKDNGFNDWSIHSPWKYSFLCIENIQNLNFTTRGILICQIKHAAKALCLPPLAQLISDGVVSKSTISSPFLKSNVPHKRDTTAPEVELA